MLRQWILPHSPNNNPKKSRELRKYNLLYITFATVILTTVNYSQPVTGQSSSTPLNSEIVRDNSNNNNHPHQGIIEDGGDQNRSSSSIIPSSSIVEGKGENPKEEDSRSTFSQEEEELIFKCPIHCDCTLYSLKKLEIDCKYHQEEDDDEGNKNNQPYTRHVHSNNNNNNSSTTSSQHFTQASVKSGIRHLILRRVNFGWTPSHQLPSILPPLREDTLNILELHDVTFEPVAFFNSHLFRSSRDSLQRLDINRAHVQPTNAAWDLIENQRSLVHFARLRELDNLTVSDCSGSPYLAQLLIQSLPGVVKHINVRNSSLSDLSPLHFSHLSKLQSLDLSRNHLKTIPPTLMENLGELKMLDVSRNRIEHLQEQVFQGLTSLKELNVSHNEIRYVDTDVFNPISKIRTIDLSYNDVIQFFEPYFENNPYLDTLRMRNTWTSKTFLSTDTSTRSRMEMERLLNTLLSVKVLDLRDNDMVSIPETLAHIPTLRQVQLQGNPWSCTCQDRWFNYWLDTMDVKLVEPYQNASYNNAPAANTNPSHLWCHSGSRNFKLQEYLKNCTEPNLYNRNPSKYYTHMGLTTMLRCHPQLPNGPIITWITPTKKTIQSASVTSSSSSATVAANTNNHHVKVLEDGNLRITNVNKADFGLYICIAQYNSLNITHYIHVGVDTSIFSDIRIMSFIIGWATSFAFLLLVIIYHMVRSLLMRCGLGCSYMNKNYQNRRVRTFFESMEQHKNSQLDWLRDNYNMQAKRIKDNCFSQVERIRESYTVQHKNLSDIRDYGTNQLHTLRDQYCDQIRRVSGYSAHQLCKVRENYLFQRNRVCKFSSHQLLRLRETYKWQAQTLNKILENLPRTLNLDTCRGIGTCGRTDSIYLEDISEFQSGDGLEYPPMNALRIPSEKMEHVSLLIPPEFLVPPGHPLDFTMMDNVKPSTSGTFLVKAEPEIHFPSDAPSHSRIREQSPEL